MCECFSVWLWNDDYVLVSMGGVSAWTNIKASECMSVSVYRTVSENFLLSVWMCISEWDYECAYVHVCAYECGNEHVGIRVKKDVEVGQHVSEKVCVLMRMSASVCA